jgi:hypothetical protein
MAAHDDNTAPARRELPPASYSAPGRDPVITVKGCRIYLHIHDAEYMRQRAEWKRRLAAAHPDKGGSATAFRSILGQRVAWQRNEALYYARLGLLPPDHWGEHSPGIHQDIRQRTLAANAARLNPDPPRTSDRRLADPSRHSSRYLRNRNHKSRKEK